MIAVPPAGARHVTAAGDLHRALCGRSVPQHWYRGDAGLFGGKGDCPGCRAKLGDPDAEGRG